MSRTLGKTGPMPPKPSPPESLPAYVVDPIERQDPDTLEESRAYANELLAYYQRQAADGIDQDELVGEDEDLVESEDADSGGTRVVKKVTCGKAACTSCPHGPYEYRVQRQGDSLEWEYIGPATDSE